MRRGRERYKNEEKRKKKSLKITTNRVVFFLILVILIGYSIFTYISFSNINSSDALKSSNSSHYLLSKKRDALEKTLIVFEENYNDKEIIQKVYMYAENKEKGEAVLVYLPGWLEYAILERDFGSSINVSAFRYAGDFLQEGRGFEYAIWQFGQLFGTNIDHYIWFSAGSSEVFKENLGEILGDSIYAQYYSNGFEVSDEAFYLNSFVSRLGWLNLMISTSKFKDSEAVIYSSLPTLANIVVKLKQIHQSTLSIRPHLIDMGRGEYVSQEENIGRPGISNYINVSKYDTTWRSFISGMIDRNLEKERVRVEVYNGSGMSGYASQYARRIMNTGCEVVRYDNAPELEDRTLFYVPNPSEFKHSLATILEIFPGTHEIIEGRPSFMTTGDIVIILGKDIPTIYSF